MSHEDRLSAIEARLACLEREQSVRELLCAYGRACDANDPDAVASLFDDHGELVTGGGVVRGTGPIRAWYAERLNAPSKHYVTNTVQIPDGDRIVVHSEFLAPTTRDGRTTLSVGSYDDVVIIVDGGARFFRRAIALEDRIAVVRSS